MLFTFFKGFIVGTIYTIAGYYTGMRNSANYRLLLFLLLSVIFLTSCEPEPLPVSETCMDGECQAYLELPGYQDNNGFYHIDLDWTGEHYPRFNILVDAPLTTKDFWYNGAPVVQAHFDTDTYWQFQNDNLPVVQPSRIYLSKYSESRASGKRIVGPFPPEMEGDTIEIYATVWWEAGINTKGRKVFAKFIVE